MRRRSFCGIFHSKGIVCATFWVSVANLCVLRAFAASSLSRTTNVVTHASWQEKRMMASEVDQQRYLQTSVDEDESDACSLCFDGSFVGFPNKTITHLLPLDDELIALAIDSILTSNPELQGDASRIQFTCQMTDFFLRDSLPASDPSCGGLRQLLGGICGCPSASKNFCRFCLDNPNPDRPVQASVKLGFPSVVTCEEIALFYTQIPSASSFCESTTYLLSQYCDCQVNPETDQGYLGATNHLKRVTLVWVQRIAGIVSGLCCLYVLYDIFVGRKQRQRRSMQRLKEANESNQQSHRSDQTKHDDSRGTHPAGTGVVEVPTVSARRIQKYSLTTKDRLVACISFFYLLIAVFLAIGVTATPTTVDGDANIYWGARGTETTCKIQGFFIELGAAGTFYLVSLTSYYLLVIRYGWTDSMIAKIELLFHLPSLAGLAMATAGLWYYGPLPFACYILVPPITSTLTEYLIFNAFPVWMSLLWSAFNLWSIYTYVRRSSRGTRRWGMATVNQVTMRRTGSTLLEAAVERQCINYFLAYAIPTFFATTSQALARPLDGKNKAYGFFLFTFFLSPLNGLFHFLVYVGPEWSRKHKDALRRRGERRDNNGDNKMQFSDHSFTEDPDCIAQAPGVNGFDESTDDKYDPRKISVRAKYDDGASGNLDQTAFTQSLSNEDESRDFSEIMCATNESPKQQKGMLEGLSKPANKTRRNSQAAGVRRVAGDEEEEEKMVLDDLAIIEESSKEANPDDCSFTQGLPNPSKEHFVNEFLHL